MKKTHQGILFRKQWPSTFLWRQMLLRKSFLSWPTVENATSTFAQSGDHLSWIFLKLHMLKKICKTDVEQILICLSLMIGFLRFCYVPLERLLHSVWKSPKMSHLSFSIMAFSTNYCLLKIDLSGNTVWPQASGFQKLAKMDHFWHF